jgi:hypothetical protein
MVCVYHPLNIQLLFLVEKKWFYCFFTIKHLICDVICDDFNLLHTLYSHLPTYF